MLFISSRIAIELQEREREKVAWGRPPLENKEQGLEIRELEEKMARENATFGSQEPKVIRSLKFEELCHDDCGRSLLHLYLPPI